jgi:hypothetical protein
LRELSSQVTSRDSYLFGAAEATRWRYSREPADRWKGENPPGRALFYYWLKAAPKGEVKIEILDAQNNIIDTLSSKPKTPLGYTDNPAKEQEAVKKAALPAEPGVQQAAWDLSYAGAEMIPNAKLDGGNPSIGPMVVPGTYAVRLTVGGETMTTSLNVLPDPRVKLTDADLKSQVDLALSVRADITRLAGIVNKLRSIRQQLANRNDLLKMNAKAEQLLKDSAALIGRLDTLEGQMHNPKAEAVYDILAMKGGVKLYSRMSVAFENLKDSDGLPAQGIREVVADHRRELDQYEAEFKRLVDVDLAQLNDAANRLGLPYIIVPE